MSNLLKSKLFLGVMVAFAFAVVASTASAAYMHTTTLKFGSRGSQVTALQGALGVTPMSGYFGNITKAAVMAFQSARGLTADGVVGPMTGAAIAGSPAMGGSYPAGCTSASGFSTTTGMSCAGGSNLPAGCTSTAGFSSTTGAKCDGAVVSTPTGPLVGVAGEISDVNKLSQYNNEEVGAGMKDVKVLGADIKATKEGDISLKSAKVSFVISNGSGSTRLTDYVDTVNVWMGSTKIGSASSADFNKDSTGNYSKTISFSSAVVRADKTEKLYVSVDALTNLDSGDIDSEVMTIGLDNVRFEDGSGVVTTDIDTGDLAISGVGVKFVDFSTAANTELKISTNSTPDSGVVKVSTTADTNDVVLLKGKMKLDGTANVWLDELPVTLTTVGGASLDDVANSVTLTLGSNTYTESLGANCTATCVSNTTAVVTFDNLDYDISAGSTVNFTVTADINDIEATTFDEGDTLLASVTSTNRLNMVVENSAGDSLTDATEKTGTAIGNAQGFFSKGINVKLVGTPTAVISHAADLTVSTDDDQGTFTITFDVTAFGSDIYVDGTSPIVLGGYAACGGIGCSDLNIASTSGTPTLTASTLTSPSGADMTGTINTTSRFKVEDGTTERFTITAVVTPAADSAVSVSLGSVAYALTDATSTADYTFNLNDFKTGDLYLNQN